MSEDDYSKFVTPRAEEELHQSELSPIAIGTNTDDGLPMQVAQRHFDKSPALSPDTLICMADTRSFVVRDDDTGEELVSFEPSQVKRFPNGTYGVAFPSEQGMLDSWHAKGWQHLPRFSAVHDNPLNGYLLVEPVRPACVHYFRMQTDLAADRDGRYLQRACMAQRSEDGEYYSVRDTMVTACSLRAPRHLETEIAILDGFDQSKIEQAEQKREQEEFDIDAELEKENLGVLG